MQTVKNTMLAKRIIQPCRDITVKVLIKHFNIKKKKKPYRTLERRGGTIFLLLIT